MAIFWLPVTKIKSPPYIYSSFRFIAWLLWTKIINLGHILPIILYNLFYHSREFFLFSRILKIHDYFGFLSQRGIWSHSLSTLSSSILKQPGNFIHTWHVDEDVKYKIFLQVFCLGKVKRMELVLPKGPSHCAWPETAARWPVSMCVLAAQPVPHVVLPLPHACCHSPSQSGKTLFREVCGFPPLEVHNSRR